MADNTTTTPAGATLTQNELFQRFLDASVRTRNCTVESTLVPAKPAAKGWSGYNHFFGWYAEHSSCLPDDIQECIVDGLCDADNPAEVIECVLADLEGLAYGMNLMKEAFNELRNATITEDTDVGVGAESVVDDARYVLPEQKAEDTKSTLRDAHAAISRLSREGVVA